MLESNEPVTQPTSPQVVQVLVDNHRRFLSFLERRVGSREVAEDILQESFVRGLAGASRLRDEDSVVAWFYRTLRNALTDHWRRRAAEQRATDHAANTGETSAPAADEELLNAVCGCVREMLDTLKPEYAEAIRRVDMEEMSVKAYAEHAGITPSNASVRLFRGREALREQLRRSCGTCATHGCLDCTCGGPNADRRSD